MDLLLEQILIYGSVALLCLVVVFLYLRKQRKETLSTNRKIEQAKEEGLYEPVSLHPVVDPNSCIKTGACILACPEKDILGIRNGKATTINASQCIGHGACFHACPVKAITLCIGTEKRGIELPHVDENFETNIPGIYIAGELGGMGLIKNAVEQGKQAVEYMLKVRKKNQNTDCDLVIVGAGPAGIAASLAAKKNGLEFKTLEQDTLGGTVFTFPRAKVVMTSAMDLPMVGKVKLSETSKAELLDIWNKALSENGIQIMQNVKVDRIEQQNGHFHIHTANEQMFSSQFVLLAIGRRGTPRKLNVPGEDTEKVAYRLLEPENIQGKKILVVGGGDSAIESALMLCDQNEVTLSYRRDKFQRIKPQNKNHIQEAIDKEKMDVCFNTNLTKIDKERVILENGNGRDPIEIENDLVYIFAGGELPTEFLKKIGLEITKKFGEPVLKHN